MNNPVLKEDIQKFAEQFELQEQLRGKTFLITGATGLIGSIMTKCLLSIDQVKIIAVVRDIEKARKIFDDKFNAIKFLQISITDISCDIFSEPVDYIIHLASPTTGKYMEENPVETFDLAYQSTSTLLNFAKHTDVKSMVYVSSLEYYGQVLDERIITEDALGYVEPMSSRSSYPMGKRAAEYLCYAFSKEYDIPVKIARLTQTLGAGISEKDNRVFAQFARSVIRGENIVLHTKGESAKPYCYTTDCISGIFYILLEGHNGEAYNVANPDTYISIFNLAEFMKEHFNPNIDVLIEQIDNMGYAPVTKLRLSAEKLMKLGWKPKYGLKDIFGRLIDSLK